MVGHSAVYDNRRGAVVVNTHPPGDEAAARAAQQVPEEQRVEAAAAQHAAAGQHGAKHVAHDAADVEQRHHVQTHVRRVLSGQHESLMQPRIHS